MNCEKGIFCFNFSVSILQLCICAEEYIFLGSRLGNSLLVRFTTEQDTVITIDDSDILGKERERGKFQMSRQRDEF